MSKRHFSMLLVIAILVGIAVFMVPSRTGDESREVNGLLMPALAGAVNDVSQVRITSGEGDVVTLERVDAVWVVSESSGYPADWSVLRPLLAGLSQAEVVEEKTSNPEYYFRLGVEDPGSSTAAGKLIEFPANPDLPAVIVGNSAQGREGQFLRLQGEARSVLVDRDITLPLNNSGWLARDIVDIADADVVSVQVTHPDGEVVAIERESTDITDFTLLNVPEGREAASSWTVNQIASVLSGLQLEGVAPAGDIAWDDASELVLGTADGLQVTVRLKADGDKRWIALEASGSESATEINERVNGWAYAIPLYKFDAMNKRMDEVLAEVAEDE